MTEVRKIQEKWGESSLKLENLGDYGGVRCN
jgi:hypothetical protein